MIIIGKPEAKIENYLKQKAKENGFLCYKYTSPSHSGVPDRILIGHGKTIFVETKKTGETIRKLQEVTIRTMREHGAAVYIIDTKEQVDQLIKTLLQS